MASDDTRSSFSSFSEDFAQARDTAENWDASDEAFAREGHRIKARLETAVRELEAARIAGDFPSMAEIEAEYEAASEEWMNYELDLKRDLLSRPGYISLAAALGKDLDSGDELSSEDAYHRRQALESLIEYVTQCGVANLGGMFKNFLAMVRKIKPSALDGISQTDLAMMLGERKASTSAREIRRVEKLAKAQGVHGFLFLGGSKGVTTRERSAQSARGNTNRRRGTRRKRD